MYIPIVMVFDAISYIDADADSIKAILKACEMLDDSDTVISTVPKFYTRTMNWLKNDSPNFSSYKTPWSECLSRKICLRVTQRHRKEHRYTTQS